MCLICVEEEEVDEEEAFFIPDAGFDDPGKFIQVVSGDRSSTT